MTWLEIATHVSKMSSVSTFHVTKKVNITFQSTINALLFRKGRWDLFFCVGFDETITSTKKNCGNKNINCLITAYFHLDKHHRTIESICRCISEWNNCVHTIQLAVVCLLNRRRHQNESIKMFSIFSKHQFALIWRFHFNFSESHESQNQIFLRDENDKHIWSFKKLFRITFHK